MQSGELAQSMMVVRLLSEQLHTLELTLDEWTGVNTLQPMLDLLGLCRGLTKLSIIRQKREDHSWDVQSDDEEPFGVSFLSTLPKLETLARCQFPVVDFVQSATNCTNLTLLQFPPTIHDCQQLSSMFSLQNLELFGSAEETFQVRLSLPRFDRVDSERL